MVNYKNGKIYKLYSSNTDIIYISFTIADLYHCLHSHKTRYNYYLRDKFIYQPQFDVVKAGGLKIICIEEYPCDSALQLRIRTKEVIKEYLNN